MEILKQLLVLGLSEKEAAVYLDLAELGQATAHVISKRTKISRTTVYWALDNLVSRGLASIEQKKTTTVYRVNQPDSMMRMVQSEEQAALQEITRKKAAAIALAKSIGPRFQEKAVTVPKLQFFEGKEGVLAMLHDHLPLWRESIAQHDFTWWGYQDPSFPDQYLDWLKLGWKIRDKNEQYKVITSDAPIERRLKVAVPNRRMRRVPDQYSFSSTIWVLGDYIVLIMSHQKPHYAFQLRNPLFSDNLRTLFKLLWEGERILDF
jgi:predicted transcriptional regulator